MSEPVLEVPKDIDWLEHEMTLIPTAKELGLDHDGILHLQTPGWMAALETLSKFLHERGEPYQKGMSSPVTGETACSRLSQHLVAGG